MKVWNYMMIMLTMMVFLYFLGFNPSGSADILSQTGIQINSTTGELIEGDVSNSSWFNDLFNATDGILAVVSIGGAIIVGLFTRQFEWKIVILPFFLFFVTKFVTFGFAIVNLAWDSGQMWLVAILATIFLPLTVMFVFSIVEWFGGIE
jgi:hypothetical protein